jgi:hypothetical protein
MTTGTQQTLVIRGRQVLPLRGWDDYSVWGLDPMETTYGLYALLWRNTDNGQDSPRHWIAEVPDVVTLVRRIAAATGCTEDEAAESVLDGLRRLARAQGLDLFH